MITERFQALGNWQIALRPDSPATLVDDIKFFGSIVVTPERIDPREHSDAGIKAMARYVGVVRRKDTTTREQVTIGGPGLLAWLGDENQRAYLYEVQRTYINQSFANVLDRSTGISAIDAARNDYRPAPAGIFRDNAGGTLTLTAGFISADSAFSGNLPYEQVFLVTPREALERVIEWYDLAEYKVNNDGTIDVGLESELFNATPDTLIVRKGWGDDPVYMGVPIIDLKVAQDAKEWAHKVVVSGSLDGTTVGLAASTALPSTLVEANDYSGSAITRIAYVNTPVTNSTASLDAAADKAVAELNDLTGNTQLTAVDFNIEGEFNVGDTVYLYDPATGHVDNTQEAYFRGNVLHPKAVRVMGITYPVAQGMGVYYRNGSGVYTDLSEWFVPDTGSVTIEVGKARRAIRSVATVWDPPAEDRNTVPDAPTGLAVTTGAYEQDSANPAEYSTLAWLRVVWNEVTGNEDGTTVIDQSHYEVQWRPGLQDFTGGYEGGYGSGYGDSLGFVDYTVLPTGSWESSTSPWPSPTGTPVHLIESLPISTFYQIRVRAVDQHNNTSDWATTDYRTAGDSIAPSKPVAPTEPHGSVTATPYSILVTHRLGKATTPSNWDLEGDLDHLNIYADTVSGFIPNQATFKAQAPANTTNLIQQIPAVGSFATTTTDTWYVVVTAVDRAGNESDPSDEVSSVALLPDIDSLVPNLTAIDVVEQLPATPETDKWYYLSKDDNITPGGPYVGDSLWSWSSNGFLNLTGGYARTLHASGLNPTTDVEIMAKLSAVDWQTNQEIVSKWEVTGNQRSYKLALSNATGRLQLQTSTNGTTVVTHESTANVPFADGDIGWVRVTLDVDNGASDSDATFYTSTDAADDYTQVTWSQLGTVVNSGSTTSIHAGTANVNIGEHGDGDGTAFTGQIYRIVVLDGLSGTPAYNVDFTEQVPATTQFTESSINKLTVTLLGNSEIGGAIGWDQESYPEDKVVATRVLAGAISAGAIRAEHIKARTLSADILAGGSVILGNPAVENEFSVILQGNIATGDGSLIIDAAAEGETSGVFIRNLTTDHISSGDFILRSTGGPGGTGIGAIRSEVLADDSGFVISGNGDAEFRNVYIKASGVLSSANNTHLGELPFTSFPGWQGFSTGNLPNNVVQSYSTMFTVPSYVSHNVFAAYPSGNSFFYAFKVGDATSGLEYNSGVSATRHPGLFILKTAMEFADGSGMYGDVDVEGNFHAPNRNRGAGGFGEPQTHRISWYGGDTPSFRLYSNTDGLDTRSRIEAYSSGALTWWQKPVDNAGFRFMLIESKLQGMQFRNTSTSGVSGIHFYTKGRYGGPTPYDWPYGGPSFFVKTDDNDDVPVVFHHAADIPNTGTQMVIDTEGTNSQTRYFLKFLVRSLSATNVLRYSFSYDGVIFIGNTLNGTPATPSAGGVLYTESGALKYKGSSGTVTTIANA